MFYYKLSIEDNGQLDLNMKDKFYTMTADSLTNTNKMNNPP